MKQDHFQHITKTNLERLKELYFALRIINDNKELIRKGNFYNISVIYGQLRSLLTDKSKNINPLLFEVASIINKELEIYYIPDTFEEELPHLTEGLLLRVSSTFPSIDKSLAKQEKIKLSEFLDVEVLTYKERKFSVRKIINEMANKYGGAHYSKTTHKYLSEVLSFGFNNQPMLDNFIYQLSDLISDIGIRLIKTVTDIEFYFHIYLTEKKVKGEIFLFDYQLPNTPNRFSLILNQGKLHLLVIDSIGFQNVLTVERVLEYDKVQLINISIEITKNFKTQLKIYIEENLVAEMITDYPLLTINEIYNYDAFYNKQKNGENQEYEFGMGELAIYSKILNHFQKLENYNHFRLKEYMDILWLEKGVFGESPSGESKINLSAEIKRKDIS